MSTIPAGLRADKMRKLIEDKATITHVGGLYVGKYMDFQQEHTEELLPGDQYMVLTSNGIPFNPQRIRYQKLSTDSFAGEITTEKLGTGGVIQDNSRADKKYINFSPNSQKHNLKISFGSSKILPSVEDVENQLYVSVLPEHIRTSWKRLPVKFDDGTEPKKYYVLQYYENGESPATTVCAYATLGILPGSSLPVGTPSAVTADYHIQRIDSPYTSASTFTDLRSGDTVYFNDKIRIWRLVTGHSGDRIGYGSPNHLEWVPSNSGGTFSIEKDINEEIIDDGYQFMVGVYGYLIFGLEYSYKNGAKEGDGELTAERTESFTNCQTGSLTNGSRIYYHDNITVTATMAPYAAGTVRVNGVAQGVAPFGEATSFSFLEEHDEQVWVLEIDQIAKPRDIAVYIEELHIDKIGDEYVERVVLRNASSHPIRVVDLNGSGFNDFYDPEGSILLNAFHRHYLTRRSTNRPQIRDDKFVTLIFFLANQGSSKLYYDQVEYPDIPE